MSEIDATAADQAEEGASGGGRKGLWLTLLLILAGAGAGTAWYLGLFGGGDSEAVEVAAVGGPPIYLDIDSNMVVNFQGGGRLRYLQIGVQVMTRDPAAVEALQAHVPLLRNNLILLFSEQTYETLSSRDGKDALRDAALAEVRGVLPESYQGSGIESVYFTRFVMQ
jgi:flagellar FliL protein